MTHWLEIVVEVSRGEADLLSDALLEAGALSVSAEDAQADSPDEEPIYAEPEARALTEWIAPDPTPAWRLTRLRVLVNPQDCPDARGLLEAACALASLDQAPAIVDCVRVAETDWVRTTQAQFDPIPIGERLLITPSWHQQPAEDTRVAVVLDPGLAFGTGGHPTTRLCLQWLDTHLRAGQSVIDYGCGSGILAIAAARLGAGPVVAVDIDPQALMAARSNAAANAVAIEVIDTASDSQSSPMSRAEVVLANILASPLKVLAPMLCQRVAPGGALVLSGILERQADELIGAYRPWLPLTVAGRQDGWVCLAGRMQEPGGR